MGEQHHHPKHADSTVHIGRVRAGERRRLLLVMTVTGVTMVGELVGGFVFGSAALLGDAFHMLTHFGAVGISYAAIVVALRPAPADKTYRNWRFEVLATLFNGVAMLPLAAYVVWEAVERWRHPRPIDVAGVLIVGGIGLVSNVISAAILHRHARHDINVRSAFLHMLADTISSVGVIAAGVVILVFGWSLADPLIAMGISLMIVFWSAALIRTACRILLESAPSHLALPEIEEAIEKEPGVADVHDLHVWTITSKMYALTAHVVLSEDVPVSRTEQMSHRLLRMLDDRFDINHATLQFETGNGRALPCERAES
ncbi:MAG: cation transporter [Planctomycetes bacterium]|nr:cation transporter [Planctomycetota bacterium]